MKKKLLIGGSIGLGVILAVVLTFILVRQLKEPSKKMDEEENQSVQENESKIGVTESDVKDTVLDRLFEIESMTITATEETEGEISPTSEFEIDIKGDVALEDLQKNLKVSVEKDYKIEAIKEAEASKSFKLSFDEPLEKGKIVSMVFDKVERPFGFAFQTKKALAVSSIYPSNNAWNVPTNSLIEIRFTKEVDASIADYIVFEPTIQGRFEVSESICRFIPEKTLNPSTSYTIKIRDGYVYEDEALEEAVVTNFQTQYMDGGNDSGFSFYSIDQVTYVSPALPIVLKNYGGPYENGDELSLSVYTISEAQEFQSYRNMSCSDVLEDLDKAEKQTFKALYDDADWENKIVLPEGLAIGYYYIVLDDGISKDGQLVQVTHYNAYLIADTDQMVLWVQNDGALTNICDVDFGDGVIGKTDEQGLLNKKMQVKQNNDYFIEIKTEEPYPIFCPLSTSSYEKNPSEDYWLYLETDRTVYLPSDEIVVSGFIKNKVGEMPEEVTVRFRTGDAIFKEVSLPLSSMGDYITSYSFEDFYQYGIQIEVLVDDVLIQEAYASISQFEKPTYKMTLDTSETVIAAGETMTAYGDVSYFEGTPFKEPSVRIDPSWRLDIGDGYETASYVKGDENGHYTMAIKPYYESDDWHPINTYIYASLNDIDTYYDQTYAYFTYVPKDMMVINEIEGDATSFTSQIFFNKIVTENIENTYADYKTYQGDPVVGREAEITIYDHYYVKHFTGQVYDPITKIFYDQYDFEPKTDIVYQATQLTDEKGLIEIGYEAIQEAHQYEISVTTKDSRGETIIETNYWGTMWIDNETSYSNQYISLETDKYYYGLGEEIKATLNNDNGRISGDDDDKVLFITVEEGIEMVKVVEGTSLDFNYPSDMTVAMQLFAIYYDGHSIRNTYDYNNYLVLDPETRKLNIDVEVDKEKYSPGETVTGSVAVTHLDGTVAEGFVDMKVVDEAYYALFGDYYNPIDDLLHNDYRTAILGMSYITSDQVGDFGGAEGGEGGEGGLRSDFKNTAYTGHILLDQSGKGTFSFKLPDNLTKWRITLGAIDPTIYAGHTQLTIDGTLPFHITLLSTDIYNEKDKIGITLKSGSSELKGTKVDYQIDVYKGKEQVFSTEVTADIQGYVFVPIGVLDEGDYTLNVKGASGDYSDGISHELQVVNSRQHVPITVKEILSENILLKSNGQIVEMRFMNDEAYERYNQLLSLLTGNKSRLEYEVTAYMALEYMASNGFDIMNNDQSNLMPYPYLDNNNLYKALENSSGDVLTTVDLLEIGWLAHMEDYEIDRVEEALKNVIYLNSHNYSEDAAALYGLSLIGQPVLLDLRESLEIEDYRTDILASMYLIKGLTGLGDYKNAFKALEDLGLYKADQSLTVADMGIDNWKAKALLMTIYSDLNLSYYSDLLYDELKDASGIERPLATQQYYYLTHLPTNILNVSFEMTYGGHTENVELDYNDLYSVTLSSEEAQEVQFDQIKGEITAVTTFIGSHEDVIPDSQLDLKTSLLGGNTVDIGDILAINSHVSVQNGMRSFAIETVLPSGTTFTERPVFSSDDVNGFVYTSSEGKNLTIYGYMYRKDDAVILEDYTSMPEFYEFDLTYKVRATSIGDYILEPSVIQDYQHNSLAVGDELLVSISE